MSSEEFIGKILVDKIQTKTLVIGYDHRFGKNREGSFEYLQSHSHLFGFELEEISRQDVDELGVSSTKIRLALAEGDIHTASKYLGRSYSLSGLVVKGQQIGRSIGFPTANIQVEDPYKLLPSDGAYAVYAEVNGTRHKAMLNIGDRPTVAGGQKTIEAHLIDFHGDLYGQVLTIYFETFLREEIRFASLEALKTQLVEDRERAIFSLQTQMK
jgi:riboflavin kinase/FMN adenylyltransferase